MPGDKCNDRQAVIDEFFNTKGKEGVTGTYDIDKDGDVTLSQFGRHRIQNGELSPSKTVKVKSRTATVRTLVRESESRARPGGNPPGLGRARLAPE